MIDCKYFQVAESRFEEWEQCYQPLNVAGELCRMILWLDSNPRRRKKNYDRFVINWLNKAYASVAVAQANGRMAARAGMLTDRPIPDYSQECEEIRKKYPDLA
jgi:hypothetical protein